MMRTLHELRRHEEGQALVLASISLLILTLCVLATANLAYAASQKIRLQNAADAAAYTTAAYQARAMNFFAYTNRAQVVQYASQMAQLAIVSYLLFAHLLYKPIADSQVPVIAWIFRALDIWVQIQLFLIDNLSKVAIPYMDALNIGAGLAQFAVWSGMVAKVMNGPKNEIESYDNRYEVPNIAQFIANADATFRWSRTVATSPLPGLTAPSNNEEKLNRALMTEIANSARNSWIAYGGKNSQFNFSAGLPRHLAPGSKILGVLTVGKFARTEFGPLNTSFAGGGLGAWLGALTGGFTNVNERLVSIDDVEVQVKVLLVKLKFSVGAQAWADRKMGKHEAYARFGNDCTGNRFVKAACKYVSDPIANAANSIVSPLLTQYLGGGGKHHWHFGMAQYARYRWSMRTNGKPRGDEWFNQPPVLVMVTLPKAKFEAPNGRKAIFFGKFGGRLGTLSSSSSTLGDRDGSPSYVRTHGPKRGFRSTVDMGLHGDALPPFDKEGLHAISAAITYYHRPGDWREPPNTFNPFWGAKLMPIADYPTLNSNFAFRTLMNAGLIAH